MIQVLMPMAGNGTRFGNGFKPFISVQGEPMYKRALQSIKCEHHLIFVIKAEDNQKYRVKETLLNEYPNAQVVVLAEMTQGALETCFLAKEFLDSNEPLLILDCDLYFSSSDLMNNLTGKEVKSSLLTFSSTKNIYSYCQVEKGRVVKTAEKEVISNHAIAGAYCFSSAGLFLDCAQEKMARDIKEKGEFYISPLFNVLIERGEEVVQYECDKYFSFGTPEDLQTSLSTVEFSDDASQS